MHCTNTPPNHHQERSVFVLSFINSDPSFTARVMNTDLSVLCFTFSLLYSSSKVVKDENIKNFYTMNTSSLIIPYYSLLSHILFLLCASFVLTIFLSLSLSYISLAHPFLLLSHKSSPLYFF